MTLRQLGTPMDMSTGPLRRQQDITDYLGLDWPCITLSKL